MTTVALLVHVRRAAALVAGAALLSSCGDATGPRAVAGAYVLESIASKMLPATVDFSLSRIEVQADTLWLEADGTGHQTRRQRSYDGAGWQQDAFEMQFTFRMRDGRIEITFVCPPLASCVEGPHMYASRQAHGLVVTMRYWSDNSQPWVYRATTD